VVATPFALVLMVASNDDNWARRQYQCTMHYRRAWTAYQGRATWLQ